MCLVVKMYFIQSSNVAYTCIVPNAFSVLLMTLPTSPPNMRVTDACSIPVLGWTRLCRAVLMLFSNGLLIQSSNRCCRKVCDARSTSSRVRNCAKVVLPVISVL